MRAKEFEAECKQIPSARGLPSDRMEVKNRGSRVRIVLTLILTLPVHFNCLICKIRIKALSGVRLK